MQMPGRWCVAPSLELADVKRRRVNFAAELDLDRGDAPAVLAQRQYLRVASATDVVVAADAVFQQPTLFHEIHHVVGGETATMDAGLEQEIDARVVAEEYRIKRGLPPSEPNYRKADGTVDRAAISKEIKGSGHYNPTTRTRIGRRYDGEIEVKGWHLPTKKN